MRALVEVAIAAATCCETSSARLELQIEDFDGCMVEASRLQQLLMYGAVADFVADYIEPGDRCQITAVVLYRRGLNGLAGAAGLLGLLSSLRLVELNLTA